ncbi:MAG: hypothetical protein EOP11_18050 [Proteobacteria bacterium]|nr:MAG: hypothetical protein EOP11_18050 [Pseudomonadota bacterium]
MIGLAFLTGCTTIDTDPSVLYTAPLYRTQIDFQPLKRETLVTQTQYEAQDYERRKAPLEDELGGVAARRKELYDRVEGDFADCRHQRHCLDKLSRGNEARFERYNKIVQGVHDLDRRAGELDNQLKLLARRFDLRERALYNRFLVNEILLTKWEHPRIQEILVHSLEAYPTRRELSHRLARLSDPDIVPTLYGDLNFSMMGKPVDEAAVLATFDVRVAPTKERSDPVRYLITFLVNTHQRDPLAYSKGFLRAWAFRLGEPGLRTLKEGVFCGIYSIAGLTLVDKLSSSKVKPCTPVRFKNQGLSAANVLERNDPEAWFLPVAFGDANRDH